MLTRDEIVERQEAVCKLWDLNCTEEVLSR